MVQQHAIHDGHKAAVAAPRQAAHRSPKRSIEPESRPLATETLSEAFIVDEADPEAVEAIVAEAMAAVNADQSLLKGRVPQAHDWLNTWAEATECISFHKQARLCSKQGVEERAPDPPASARHHGRAPPGGHQTLALRGQVHMLVHGRPII